MTNATIEGDRLTDATRSASDADAWKRIVAGYQQPDRRLACWQLANSVGSYLALWAVICVLAHVSLWLALPVALVAGAMLVRVFIIFHDCGHGSFFASRRANGIWGFLTGVLAFTPYDHWRGQHAIHHGTTGNLDRRGVGDVWTMTVREYLASPRHKRLAYRFARHPFVLLAIAPLLMFVVEQRVPNRGSSPKERLSVWWTNLALLGWAIGLGSIMGFVPWLVIQLTILAVAGAIGVWLFYLQHQFEDAYWERGEDWDFVAAALEGSAFLRLPRVLQWFTGNIGFHHIHHLSSRIPNYKLQACHESHPMFGEVSETTLARSVKAFSLALWDEASRKLVRFRHLRTTARC